MIKKSQHLIVHFKDDRVYLCPKPIDLISTNIPRIASKFEAPAHWLVRVDQHFVEEHKLALSIISYHQGSADISTEQKVLYPLLETIDRIAFRSIDTERLLASAKSPRIATNTASERDFVPKTTRVTKVIQIPVNKLTFHLGRVSFMHRFKGFSGAAEISIENQEVREEFDAIKNYFEKVFGKKKIQAKVVLEMDASYAKIISASSTEINSINKDLIESVRFEFVRSLKKQKAPNIDKSLFTAEELLAHFGQEDFKSNTFHKNDKDLFADLLQTSDSKHYLHLRYLSSIHASHILKLRFIHDPFSFIFLVEGDQHYHIIWETLDTEEATYLWHIDKDLAMLKLTLMKIEQIIHTVRVQGKTAYLNSNETDRFRRIYHDYSMVKEGFLRWKAELDTYLS